MNWVRWMRENIPGRILNFWEMEKRESPAWTTYLGQTVGCEFSWGGVGELYKEVRDG